MERTKLSMMPPWEDPKIEPLFPPRRAQPKSRLPVHFRGKRGRNWLPIVAAVLALATGGAAFATRPRVPSFAPKTSAAPVARKAVVKKTKKTTMTVAKPKKRVAAQEVWAAAAPGPVALLDAGHLLYRSGKYDRAEDAYRDALAKDRDDGEARFWLAAAEWRQGKRWRACRHFRIYAERFPDGRRIEDARDGIRACDS